ncbi:hypothetical protein [Leptospira jelokensis]|uniref:hypothetical protein n=1 Tax=Leptospira jelokensis TaxID=2484931 RepID=UPI00109127BA|nr:hypothetical protein [Leptospira jelokensis]TGM03561.1 hypothetical protein EHQ79_06330 [Leptospira jelokensis]
MIKIYLKYLIFLTFLHCSFSFGIGNGSDEEEFTRSEILSILALANSNRNIILGSTRIFKSTVTSSINNTPLAISFDTSVYDTNNIFNLNDPTKVTINRSGLYYIQGQLSYSTNGTGIRKANLVLNDLSVIGSTALPAASGDLTNISTESTYRLNVGDFLRLQGFQSSGGNLDIVVNSGYSQILSVTKLSE